MLCTRYTSPIGDLALAAAATESGAGLAIAMFIGAQKKPAPALPLQEISGETSPEADLLREAMRQFDAYFSRQLRDFSLPIAQEGTDFRQRVWVELQKIPYGTTITYLALARRLGDEKCIRAAATANGSNRLNIVVPCHRVIGSGGDLTGFGGDLWRKEWLLKHEGALSELF